MTDFKVKSDQDLFDNWKVLGKKISLLSSIVQNDMTLSEQDINDWMNQCRKIGLEFRQLVVNTKTYVMSSEES